MCPPSGMCLFVVPKMCPPATTRVEYRHPAADPDRAAECHVVGSAAGDAIVTTEMRPGMRQSAAGDAAE